MLETDSKGETITQGSCSNSSPTARECQCTDKPWSKNQGTSTLQQALLPLIKEDENHKDAALSLFRLEFIRKSKELIDQVKAIRSTTQKDGKSFFQQGLPRFGGFTINDLGEAEARALGKAIVSFSLAKVPSGPNDRFPNVCKSFNNKLQKYSRLPDCMHGGE